MIQTAMSTEEKQRLVSLTEVMLDLLEEKITASRAREILRSEGYPPEVWRKIIIITAE